MYGTVGSSICSFVGHESELMFVSVAILILTAQDDRARANVPFGLDTLQTGRKKERGKKLLTELCRK